MYCLIVYNTNLLKSIRVYVICIHTLRCTCTVYITKGIGTRIKPSVGQNPNLGLRFLPSGDFILKEQVLKVRDDLESRYYNSQWIQLRFDVFMRPDSLFIGMILATLKTVTTG